jgi:hypothetical protein
MWVCDACRRAGTLQLNVVVHAGEAVITHLRDFERLAGEDVIVTLLNAPRRRRRAPPR